MYCAVLQCLQAQMIAFRYAGVSINHMFDNAGFRMPIRYESQGLVIEMGHSSRNHQLHGAIAHTAVQLALGHQPTNFDDEQLAKVGLASVLCTCVTCASRQPGVSLSRRRIPTDWGPWVLASG
jgi:hypothetical protein